MGVTYRWVLGSAAFGGQTFNRASQLAVDHIIPLKWAHDNGGANWSAKQKERFANDPANLLVVVKALNSSNGAKGPADWMPPNHGYRCEYLGHWKRLLAKYPDLKMTHAERRVFDRQLQACGIQPLHLHVERARQRRPFDIPPSSPRSSET